MDYLSRDSAPFSEEFWGRIDDTIVDSASRILIGRRFLTLYGPVSYTHLDVYKRQGQGLSRILLYTHTNR